MDRLVYEAQQAILRAEMLKERDEMLCMGISRDDMPYKPNPWQDMVPIDDGKRSIPPTLDVDGNFWVGAINALCFEIVLGLSIYGLAHWHVWAKMSEIVAAWRGF